MRSVFEVARAADEFFMGQSRVHSALQRITSTLDAMNIPYAVVGAMAVNAYGHVRTTADVDLLLTPNGLAAFKKEWLGRGWLEKFPGSKGFRDTIDDVKIDVLLTGEFPGDGKPKPVVFPDPAIATRNAQGTRLLSLRQVLELKLASGMTAPHRPRDFDDVIALIRVNALPEDFAIDPYVGEKYRELWALSKIEDDA